MITPETKMKLDREFTVKVWHVVAYNVVLIVALVSAFVRVQVNVEQLIKLTDKIETRVTATERAIQSTEARLPVIDTRLAHIQETLQEIKEDIKRRP